ITDVQVHRSRIPESKKRNTRQRTTQPQTIVDFFAACAHSITDTPQPTGKRTTETVAFFELPFCDPAVHRVACTGPHARLLTPRPLAALRPAGIHRPDASGHGHKTQAVAGTETRSTPDTSPPRRVAARGKTPTRRDAARPRNATVPRI